jgi:hypothetical protein
MDRKAFWTKLSNNGLLSLKSLVIVGDLNLTLSSGESWGGAGVTNASFNSNFYNNLFLSHNLLDVRPDKLVPTW